MPTLNSPSPTGRYIVRSEDPVRLNDFIKTVNTDPQIELVDTIGPSGSPHTAVVTMSHDTARALQERFSNTKDSKKLIIEPDRPLSLFDGDGTQGS